MDQRNLLIAIALSIVILVGFQFLLPHPAPPPVQPSAEQAPPGPPAAAPVAGAPPLQQPAAAGPAPLATDRKAVIAAEPRLPIRSARVHGSIALKGGRIDDITLPDYRVTVDPASPEIVLLTPPGTTGAYYAEFGWVPGRQGTAVPDADTEWTTQPGTLTPERPVTLSWDNGQGLRFTRTYALDRDFVFTVTQTVENTGTEPAALHAYGLVSRTGTPKTAGFYILHEGPIGVIDGTLQEYHYDDLRDAGKIEATSVGGWLGITDKYWLVSLIPDQQAPIRTRFAHSAVDGVDKYQVDYLREAVTLAPGERASVTDRLFAGAKEVNLIDRYEEQLGITRFDRAVDWGWFYFLTKPIFHVLDWLKGLLGNFGLAILAITVLFKLAFFPLANKSYRAMSQMKNLQPEMMKLRERFGDDKARMNQELMALYRREKVNPAAGCLPILIQIPVFFSLYKVLFVTIELRHAPFYGWIEDLSAPDPTNIFTLFGLIPWAPPDLLHLGLWPLIMGATMFAQQRLNPQPADPVQARVFMLMPVIFTVLLARFPAGLVIYWAWNNFLSIIQQWVIMRRHRGPAPKPAVKTGK